MSETPLHGVDGWSLDHVRRLGESWITTAEQVVALSATPGGLLSISEQLNVPQTEAARLVSAARAKLDPAVQQMLQNAAEVDDFGLGVLPPPSPPDRG